MTPSRFAAAAAAALLIAAPSMVAAQRAGQRPAARRPAPAIPTPRSVLGFDPGDDRKLAEWPVLVRYYQALARASDRVEFRELGKTTLGAPFIALGSRARRTCDASISTGS